MGIFSRFESRVEDGLEGAADRLSKAPISPVQISKRAEKAMRRERMVGAGRQYAPTLYTVLVNADDDQRLFGYYPTLAGETETYLSAKAAEMGYVMDGQPLVRFVVDEGLRHGKFDIIAELVSAPIVKQLRAEEMRRYGIGGGQQPGRAQQAYGRGTRPQAHRRQQPSAQQGYAQQPQYAQGGYAQGAYGQDAGDQAFGFDPADPEPDMGPRQGAASNAAPKYNEPLPYVPEDEIDRSIDYGEYTFNSRDFEDYEEPAQAGAARQEGHDDGLQDSAYARHAAGMAAAGAASAQAAAQAAGLAAAVPSAASTMPATPAQAVVPARLVDLATMRTWDLSADRILLGRSSSCDIAIDDINISRSHAELRRSQDGFWSITDLGSTNGTQVNGRPAAMQALRSGDRITIGTSDLLFEQG